MKRSTTSETWLILILSTLYSSIAFTYTAQSDFSYPIWNFLTSSTDRFSDFYSNLVSDSSLWFPSRRGFTLFPGSVILYKLLSSSHLSELGALVIFNVLTYLLLATSVLLVFRSFGVRLLIFLSYPIFFSFWRANNETLLLALFLIAFLGLQKDTSRNDIFSGAALGLQAAIEGNPFLLVALYPSSAKRFRRFTFAFFAGVASCVATFWYLSRTNLFEYLWSLQNYIRRDAGLDHVNMHNHSLVAGVSGWMQLVTGEFPNLNTSLGNLVFLLVIPLVAISWLIRIAHTEIQIFDRLICAVCLALLLPIHSFTYRQIWLLVPLGLLLERDTQGRRTFVEWLQIGLMAILILPKTFVWIKSPTDQLGHYESTLIDPVLCLVLLVLTARKYFLRSSLNFRGSKQRSCTPGKT